MKTRLNEAWQFANFVNCKIQQNVHSCSGLRSVVYIIKPIANFKYIADAWCNCLKSLTKYKRWTLAEEWTSLEFDLWKKASKELTHAVPC